MTPNHSYTLDFHFYARFRQLKNPIELFVLAHKNQQRDFACKRQTSNYGGHTEKPYRATKFLPVQHFKLHRNTILRLEL